MIRKVAVLGFLAVSVTMLGFAGWMVLGGSHDGGDCAASSPVGLTTRVVATHPHDVDAFTQGLLVDRDGRLWESTGLRGHSALRMLDVDTGEVSSSVALEGDLFGEGLTQAADGELIQLTWTAGLALRWNPEGPSPVGEFDYDGEGWGITTLDDSFHAMSDGSDTLTFRSPEDFSEVGTMRVEREGGPSDALNELEWDGTHLWANRYQSDEILRIDLDCGVVDAVVDAQDLVDRARVAVEEAGLSRDLQSRDVLNGIAWLGEGDPKRYYVTGKRWPVLFEVEFTPS